MSMPLRQCGRAWLLGATLAAGALHASAAAAAIYVYQLPDGSRMVTDHPLTRFLR